MTAAAAGASNAEVVRRLLHDTTTWAVVGLRDNPARPAYGMAHFLQRKGKRIVPVHQHPQDVHGERAYARLADIPFPVDVVDVFVNSSRAGAVADQAVAIGAKAVWFQVGVIDDGAYQRVTEAGLDMVMDRCPVIDWPMLARVVTEPMRRSRRPACDVGRAPRPSRQLCS